jgi:Flp pilus assembly protein TadD
MEIGKNDAAMAYAYRAVQIEPQNSGVHANLALAYLLAGQITDAQKTIDESLAMDPADKISQTIAALTKHFAANGLKPPNTTPALLDYWRKNRKA